VICDLEERNRKWTVIYRAQVDMAGVFPAWIAKLGENSRIY
jgi:hypothetical protein